MSIGQMGERAEGVAEELVSGTTEDETTRLVLDALRGGAELTLVDLDKRVAPNVTVPTFQTILDAMCERKLVMRVARIDPETGWSDIRYARYEPPKGGAAGPCGTCGGRGLNVRHGTTGPNAYVPCDCAQGRRISAHAETFRYAPTFQESLFDEIAGNWQPGLACALCQDTGLAPSPLGYGRRVRPIETVPCPLCDKGRAISAAVEAGTVGRLADEPAALAEATTTGHAADPAGVDHPAHYNQHPSGVECIAIVEHMTFNVGNAVKYCWRAGLKNDEARGPIPAAIKDLKKAAWYLAREIERLEKELAKP